MSHANGGEIDLEQHRSHEIVRDEDVLSVELQRELESVGSAVGVIAAFALVASQLARARRFFGDRTAASENAGQADDRRR